MTLYEALRGVLGQRLRAQTCDGTEGLFDLVVVGFDIRKLVNWLAVGSPRPYLM